MSEPWIVFCSSDMSSSGPDGLCLGTSWVAGRIFGTREEASNLRAKLDGPTTEGRAGERWFAGRAFPTEDDARSFAGKCAAAAQDNSQVAQIARALLGVLGVWSPDPDGAAAASMLRELETLSPELREGLWALSMALRLRQNEDC